MNICTKLEDLEKTHHKLLLIIGKPGSGKSRLIREYSEETGVPIVDLDKIFLHTPADLLMKEMKEFIKTYHQKVLLVDNKKILYAKDGGIDLLAFLKEISQDIIVVTTWNGTIEDGQLFHFCKDSPEDLIYSVEKEDFKYILC